MPIRINPAFRAEIKRQMQLAAAGGIGAGADERQFTQYLSSCTAVTNEVCYWAARYGVPVKVISKGGSIKTIIRENLVCECCNGTGHK